MAPPFWVHCNICCVPYTTELPIFMLNCSHTLCKNCMKRSNGGKNCPICKESIKFEVLSKLKPNVKAFFDPNAIKTIHEPIKKLSFQQKHQQNLFRLLRESKMKCKKASTMKEKLEQETRQLKAHYMKMVDQRKLMQEKLKQIYMKNQQAPEMAYRNPRSTPSFKDSTRNTSIISTPSSRQPFKKLAATPASTVISDFFNANAPMMRASQVMNEPSRTMQKTTRKPFFA